MLHRMPVTGHPIAPRPSRSPASLRRRKERTHCSDRLGVLSGEMLGMCEYAGPQRLTDAIESISKEFFIVRRRGPLIICNRAYGELLYPALGTPRVGPRSR